MRWIYKTATGKNPLQLNFPFALWTRPMISTLIARKFGVKLSLSSVGKLLSQLGLSCQKPLFRAWQQDASRVQLWLEREIVKSYVDSTGGKFRLFSLPPYSPEQNPDELVWNDVKNNGVARSIVNGPKDLHRVVVDRLRFLQKTPERVRSFFQAPETRYAA